jgi:hypothetical protein
MITIMTATMIMVMIINNKNKKVIRKRPFGEHIGDLH